MYKRTRSVLSLMILTIALLSCNSGNNGLIPSDVVNNPNTARGKSDPSTLPVITFEEEMHDFGKIIEGESVAFNFTFRNTGKTDLLIADVTTGCGCAVPSYPKTPIRPNEEGILKVTFNSVGKRGYQTKSIVVLANTQPNTTVVRIKAHVVGPGNE